MRRQLTCDERGAVKRLIDAHHRRRKGIPGGHVAKLPVGDPTSRFSDSEIRAAVRRVADTAWAEHERKFDAGVEDYFMQMDACADGSSDFAPAIVRFPECTLGMRTYERFRDRTSDPAHNTIRRRYGSFCEFVLVALGEE